MSVTPVLPVAFADLQPHAGWALPTETERNTRRLASTQAELEAFATAMVPRLDDIAGYLSTFPLNAMPEEARALFHLMLSVAEVAPAVESYRRSAVPFGFDSRRFKAQEESPLRPRP
jgi:hypothetical protein